MPSLFSIIIRIFFCVQISNVKLIFDEDKMFLFRTQFNVEIAQIGRYNLLMMRDSTICEGGSTFDFLFLGKMSFSLSRYLGFFFLSSSFPIVLYRCMCMQQALCCFDTNEDALGRTACASSSSFFSLALPLSLLLVFFRTKRRRRREKKRSSATYNGSTATRK